MIQDSSRWRHWRLWRLWPLWLAFFLLLYLVLTCYQLNLPGLHYDEAREAGLNALELLTGAPVTAFRSAGLTVAGHTLPLMVQDYIGALNVYLALPFLALTGVGVPNLRVLPVLTGLIALLLIERTLNEWGLLRRQQRPWLAGLLAVAMLALSPSYLFWARQGIFVTNLTLPFVFLCLWQGLRWLRTGRPAALVLAGLGAGLALYAKLVAVWVIAPFGLLAGGWWLGQHLRKTGQATALSWLTVGLALAAFVIPLLPLLLFNMQTGGTLASVGGSLDRSYYGVNNADVLANLPVRAGQVLQVLRGEQFWYLGGSFANAAAPWLALLLVTGGLWANWRTVAPPLLLAGLAFAASLFTVSDLFVTHYALLQPVLVATVAVAAAALLERAGRLATTPGLALRWTVVGLLVLWLALDLANVVRYHAALGRSGGLADHSDASYHLAYHLRYNGMGAPIALDWGMDAPVRYLTNGTVTPIEIFGYASPAAPDDQFLARLAPFLANPDNRYLLHAPAATVFAGRREAFLAAVAALSGRAILEQQFAQRDGAPLYEIWRVEGSQ